MQNFDDISYLKNGSEIQRLAHQTLTNHQVFEKLNNFSPILTGTIPIDIAVSNSDLDICCCYINKADFIDTISQKFGGESHFNIRNLFINGEETVIANFYLDDFEIEIFGQKIPVKQQNAYRHMIIEHHILNTMGENFKREVIELKSSGNKTEPAFARLLNLSGDPYQALLNLNLSDLGQI